MLRHTMLERVTGWCWNVALRPGSIHVWLDKEVEVRMNK